MSFKIGVSRDQEGQRRTIWTRRCVFTHAAVGRVENCQQGWQDTMMKTTLTDHSRWPRGMCRERTSTVKLAVDLPEGHEQVGKLAKLCRSMYGTRDAASIWGNTWSDVLKKSSMKVGSACPAFFCSCDGDLKKLCHGDDFCGCTTETVAKLWKSP